MKTLDDAITDALFRLDDEDEEVWTRAEIALYTKDGYDKFCRQSKCIFDVHVIENRPPIGNYGSDLQRYLAEQTPGMGLADRPMQYNTSSERDLLGTSVSASEQATPGTQPRDQGNFASFANLSTTVSTGRVPDGTVDILSAFWNNITLSPIGMAQLRRMDPLFDTNTGDTRFWAWDENGINTIRFYPAGGGAASYDTVSGWLGTIKQTSTSATDTIYGTRGVLRERVGNFPAGGPRGTVRQRHPDTDNFKLECVRLGRNLDGHAFEIPDSFVKYIVFYAMSRALLRDGPGQDVKLGTHYAQRFAHSLDRMENRKRRVNKERVGRIAFRPDTSSFGLGDPTLPYNYGPPSHRKVSGGY